MGTNAGVLEVEHAEVDMTGGISGAGVHSWDPAANTGLADPESVEIVGRDGTAAGLLIYWDHTDGTQFLVKENVDTGDGTGGTQDAAAGTNAGKVRVRVTGRR
jgi:hypothetical protein